MIEAADAGFPLRRAFLRVAGKSLARHQLGVALALDCDRVICLARTIAPELIALQHEAEGAGKLFHIAGSPKDIAGLVSANDELFVFSDGLLVEPEEACRLLEGGQAVLVQPAEVGVPAGFERIDLNHASAGLARVPGRLVERLFELPADCDVSSALPRIALQSGLSMRDVPAAARANGSWQMIRNEADASGIENEWLGRQLGDDRSLSPGRWLARLAVQIFGSSLLHAGNSSRVMSLVMIAVMLVALGTAWLGYLAAGFALCALAWVVQRTAILLQRIEGPYSARTHAQSARSLLLGWVLDLELVLFALWAAGEADGRTFLDILFPPAMLILLVRFVPRLRLSRWSGWLSDRMLLFLLLAAAAALGAANGAVVVTCLFLGIAGIAGTSTNRD